MKKLVLVLLLAASFIAVNAQEYVIIVNKNCSLKSITKDQLRKTYTGIYTKLIPVDLPETDPIALSFKLRALGLTPANFKQTLINNKVTGIPLIQPNSLAVKQYIANNNNVIGYVDPSVVDASVKIIRVLSN